MYRTQEESKALQSSCHWELPIARGAKRGGRHSESIPVRHASPSTPLRYAQGERNIFVIVEKYPLALSRAA
jgi:hypothetical protein